MIYKDQTIVCGQLNTDSLQVLQLSIGVFILLQKLFPGSGTVSVPIQYIV